MLRRLRTRGPANRLPHEPRRHRHSAARWIYLISALGLLLWLGNFFFGSLFYLRSEGMLVAEHAVVGAEFPVTVREIKVHEGDHVNAGEVVAVVTSQTVAESLARLAAEVAAQENQASQLRVRDQTIAAIINVAQQREQVAADARRQLETLQSKGWLPIDKRVSAVESDFRSREDLEKLRAEHRAIEGEIGTINSALSDAHTAFAKLRQLYDDGKMRAPITGVVTTLGAHLGSVMSAGQPLLEIYGGPHYVLAYLPTGGLYRVSTGERVDVSVGLQHMRGEITRIEPVAAALPREFQRAFRPVERQQLIRVDLGPNAAPLPLFTTVQIRSVIPYEGWATTFTRYADQVLNGARSIPHWISEQLS